MKVLAVHLILLELDQEGQKNVKPVEDIKIGSIAVLEGESTTEIAQGLAKAVGIMCPSIAKP